MIGTTISHYRIISHVAAGGMGTVYLAEDEHLKRRVALKFLPPDTGSNTDAAARLLREARAASALDHPHIATVYEIGRHAGQPFIAMAYYEGETLAARLARGPLPIAEAADLLAQLADALAAAHAAGVVHRDVKPSNVMLTSTGPVKVLDFGLAQTPSVDTTTRLTLAGTTVGTAAYMSPEQAAGEEVDQRTDLWALGVVTYEMLAGVLPFKGANALSTIHAVLTATPAPIRMLRPDVAAELEAVVSRTLVRDRESRTISAGEVRGLAAACRERLAGRAAPAAAAHHARRWWIAAAIAAVALAGGGVWRVERNTRVTWARREALPEIVRLAGADRFDEAYRLAERAEPDLRDDPISAEQLRTIARPATIVSDPPGAASSTGPTGTSVRPGGRSEKRRCTHGCRMACCTTRRRWPGARARKTWGRSSSTTRRASSCPWCLQARRRPGWYASPRRIEPGVSMWQGSIIFLTCTCPTTGSIDTRSRTARTNGLSTTTATAGPSCGASRSRATTAG